jgi:ABC-type transporter Mla MlaB component
MNDSTNLSAEAENNFSDNSAASLTGEWVKISLQPTLTLAELNDLKNELSESIGCRVQLHAAQIERIDTAALQLLLAFVNNPEVTVGWVEPSAELCKAAHLLGLSSFMSLPTEPSPTLVSTQ